MFRSQPDALSARIVGNESAHKVTWVGDLVRKVCQASGPELFPQGRTPLLSHRFKNTGWCCLRSAIPGRVQARIESSLSLRRRVWPARFPPLLGGGLEPRFRVLFSAIFHLFPRDISIRVETCGSERKQKCGKLWSIYVQSFYVF